MIWRPPAGCRVWVVEPHADDAFLSLGGHIARWRSAGDLVGIVTVYSGTRRRASDAGGYAQAVGAEWVGFGWVEDDLGAGEREVRPVPSFEFAGIAGDGDEWIFPVGIGHPEHVAVAAGSWGGCLAYVDQPYAARPSRADQATEALAGRRIVSWLRPSQARMRHAGLFRDQAKFFHFNPPERLGREITEVIVSGR